MASPPTGILTFLFTDIQGSTRLWERDAKRMQRALARHDEILKSTVESHGGYVFKMVGDACCAAFSSTQGALEAALSAQRAIFSESWDEECRIRVRMALHTGEVEERDGDYFGPPVNRVARLLSAGHGGQTLISQATRELVDCHLSEGISLRDMGDHRLKDLKDPEHIFQLLAPELPSEFPPLKTLEATSEDDRYRLITQIGSGGMAEVYLAYDEVLEREVAFKVLDRKHVENREAIERFRREARNAASLDHTNIVSIYDRGHTEAGTYYLVMEYMEGGTLEDLIEREGPLSPQRGTEITLQIAKALQVAHEKGVIHRDIKPQNILLSKSGEAKVADFGIARAATATTMTQVGSVMGTVHYMSPEQALGEPATPRSDLYSLGVVLYEMLTGELPYDAETPAGVVMKHVSGLSRSPRDTKIDVPEELDAITARLLAKDPDDRYPDASALVEDLERAKEGLPLDAATTERRGARKPGRGIQRRGILVALASVVVSIVIVAAVASVRGVGPFAATDRFPRLQPGQDTAPLDPGRYATDKFVPPLSLAVDDSWQTTGEYTDILELVPKGQTLSSDLRFSALDFNHIDTIFDPDKQGLIAFSNNSGLKSPAPENIITWLQGHPYLKTSEPEPVTIGGRQGVAIDAEVSPTPRDYSVGCGGAPCVILFGSVAQGQTPAGFVGLPAGGKSRFIVLKGIEGETVVISTNAYPSNRFNEFRPKAQRVLDTVEWESSS